jgi:quinol monooxygenase YgiN
MSIIVDYEINDGCEEQFETVMTEHARRTLHEEPGCLGFEVLRPVDEAGEPIAGRLMVSEVYADAAAIDAHRNNPRMAIVRKTLAPLVKTRTVVTSRILSEPPLDTGLTPSDLNASNDG